MARRHQLQQERREEQRRTPVEHRPPCVRAEGALTALAVPGQPHLGLPPPLALPQDPQPVPMALSGHARAASDPGSPRQA